jgi:hypothetical protein
VTNSQGALLVQRRDGTPHGSSPAGRFSEAKYPWKLRAVRFTRKPESRLTSGGSSAGAHPATAAAITYFVATPRGG